MSSRNQERLIRQWEIMRTLLGHSRGVTVKRLSSEMEVHRATIYRDLSLMIASGLPIDVELINGERWYRVNHHADLPPLRPTRLQLMALHVARQAMRPLEGTSAVQEFDALLDKYLHTGNACSYVSIRRSQPQKPDRAYLIEKAIQHKRRIRICYRGKKDASPDWRLVDPIALRLANDQLYLAAFDLERGDWRLFKIARVSEVIMLEEKAANHRDYDENTLFGRSVKVWAGDAVDVAVRLSVQVARFASEYPLMPDQSVESANDGSVIVRARVAGFVEAAHWVLGWGKDAVALEPREFRELLRAELLGALAGYESRARILKRPVARDLRKTSGM